jgi:hypothetical protein
MEYQSSTVDEHSEYVYTLLIILSLITIVSLLPFVKTRQLIKKIDVYYRIHNYERDKYMVMRRTLIGGIASIIFIFLAISVVSKMSLTYILDNITETKTLVPIIALEQEYNAVIFT